VLPWKEIARTVAPDGTALELRARGQEYLIRAGGRDLMSADDALSSAALGTLGCAHLRDREDARVLIGGLGLGYTPRATLDALRPGAQVELAELVADVVTWNREHVGHLAGHPLEDPRTVVQIADVADILRSAQARYDAVLLDVDNGPDALVHRDNDALYGSRGLQQIRTALRPAGWLAVWSFSRDATFESRLRKAGFRVTLHEVTGAPGNGRGRTHFVFEGRLGRG
jgi:spermidine synthase